MANTEKQILDPFEDLFKLIQNINSELKQTVTIVSKELKTASSNLNKNSGVGDVAKVQKYNESLKQTVKRKDDLTEIEKQVIAERKKLEKIVAKRQVQESDLSKEIAKQTEKQRARAKQIKEEIKLQNADKTSLVSMRAELKKMTAEYASASAVQRKQMIPALKELNTQVVNAERAVGNHGRVVGQYENALTKLKGVFLGGFGLIAVIGLFVKGVKNAINTSIKFEKQMSKVKAVTGATSEQIKELSNDAKRLGGETKFTATNVAELQEELGRLGFSVPEIKASSKAILDLAAATDESLSDIASLVGSTTRAFRLSAGETGRVSDVMAKSFSKSALAAENYSESIKLVAPIASKANVSIETTTALLGELANNGLKGSIAGTGLKNVLTKLTDANSALSKEIGFVVRNDEDLIRAMNVMKDRHIDLTKATELTDERSKAAFLTLMSGIDTISNLSDELRKASGSAKEMADTMQDNLAGSMEIAGSAYEKMILNINTGNSAFSQSIRWVIDNFAELFDFLGDKASDDPYATLRSGLKKYHKTQEEVLNKVKTNAEQQDLTVQESLRIEQRRLEALIKSRQKKIEIADKENEEEAEALRVKMFLYEQELGIVNSLYESELNRIKLQKEQQAIDKANADRIAQREAETGKIIDLKNAQSELFDYINSESGKVIGTLNNVGDSQRELNVEFEKMQAPETSPITFWSLLAKEVSFAGDALAENQQNFADIASTFNSITEIYSNLTAEQVEANINRIEAYNDRIGSLESRVTESLNEQAEGRANTANREIDELERLKAKRAEAQRENEKIARRQIIISKLAQSAKIVEATANIFASNTLGNPIGVISALAQIGVMLSSLASTKAQVQGFAEGGKIRGEGTTTSDSIPIMASDKEFMVKASSAEKSDRLLNMINSGKIDDRVLNLLNVGTNDLGGVTQDYSHVNNNTSAINTLTNSIKNLNLQSNTRKGKVYMVNGRIKN
jgi:TP901 family phage tail tape measure protein